MALGGPLNSSWHMLHTMVILDMALTPLACHHPGIVMSHLPADKCDICSAEHLVDDQVGI